MGWNVLAPVEYLGIRSSCGCSQAVLTVGEQPVTPGVLATGTAGTAKLGIKGDRQLGPSQETLSILWRAMPDGPVHVAVLTVKAILVEAYAVMPQAILVTEAPRTQPTPFSVEWQPLRPVAGVARLGELPANVLVAGVEQYLHAGRPAFRVQGMVNPGAGQEQDLLFSLQIEGLTPAPPPVPVNVQYQRRVEVRPFGLVELRLTDSESAAGRATITIAADTGPFRLLGLRVEPAILRERVHVATARAADTVFHVDLSVALQDDSFVRGSVLVDMEPTGLGPIEIPWIYLKKSTSPPARGAPAVPTVQANSTTAK